MRIGYAAQGMEFSLDTYLQTWSIRMRINSITSIGKVKKKARCQHIAYAVGRALEIDLRGQAPILRH